MTKSSIEQLYQQYSGEVYLYAFSLCKNHYDAQELVSDAFFKAMLSLKQENGEFKYWLFRVCKNSWIDGIKKRKYLLDQPIEEFALSDNDAFKQIILKEERRALYEAIQQLSQTYQEILILYYYCDIPLMVISEMMNISYSASRMLISRARKCLGERLNKEDFI